MVRTSTTAEIKLKPILTSNKINLKIIEYLLNKIELKIL